MECGAAQRNATKCYGMLRNAMEWNAKLGTAMGFNADWVRIERGATVDVVRIKCSVSAE